jgi:hypothetical protein
MWVARTVEIRMSVPVKLNDEDVAYLLTLLRNTSQPITTQQLIDVLRRQSGSPVATVSTGPTEG